MKTRRGLTFLELIVAVAVLVFLTALGQVAITNVVAIAGSLATVPPAQTNAVDIVNAVAGAVRRAPLCVSGGIVNAAVQAGSAASVTLCTSGTAYVTYSIDGSGNFIQTTGTLPTGGATTVTILEPGAVILNLQYCLSNASTPNVVDTFSGTDPLTDTSTSNSQITWISNASLTSAQLPKVLAVKITATITRNGSSVSYDTIVRMRNSPA